MRSRRRGGPAGTGPGLHPNLEPLRELLSGDEGGVTFRNIGIALLFIIVLAGATGGDDSVSRIGAALGQLFHWVNVAWNSLTAA